MFSGIEAASVAWNPLGWQCLAVSEIDKFPNALLAYHYPDIPNLGDVTKVDWESYRGKADVVVGGPPCFIAGTLILCERGLTPIEEVSTEDKVLTHTGRYQPVVNIGSTVSKTIIVKGQGHYGLETTQEHPFLSTSYKRVGWKRDEAGKAHPYRSFAEPEWAKAEDLVGRFWATPCVFPEATVPLVPDMDTPLGFWWMIGAFLGNGWTTSGKRSGRPPTQERSEINICTAHEKSDLLEQELAKSGLRFRREKQKTATRFVAHSLPLRRWIDEHFGKYAHGKFAPSWLLGLPQEARREVLAGYIFTDGCVHGNSVRAISVSKRLAVAIRLLAGSLGFATSLEFTKREPTCVIEGRTVNQRSYWSTCMYNHSRSVVLLGNHQFSKVKLIQSTNETKVVYNLEVQSDNSYTADGIVVHNCQAFSVAGLRNSLSDDRGNLSLEYVRAIRTIDPKYSVTENVPGWLSAKDNAFGCVLAGLVGADNPLVPPDGSKWGDAGLVVGPERTAAWRILDAQHFRLAQRRRRVFVVSCRTRDGINPAAILFESQSLCRNLKTSRKAGQTVAALTATGVGTCGADDNQGQAGHLIADINGGLVSGSVQRCLNAKGGMGRIDAESETFVATPILEAGARTGTSTTDPRAGIGIGEPGDPMFTLQSGKQHAVFSGSEFPQGYRIQNPLEPSETITANPAGGMKISPTLTEYGVRRLTPTECERLQGFPDGYTLIPYRGKLAADGPRYKALGNTFAVPCVKWIGERIEKVERISRLSASLADCHNRACDPSLSKQEQYYATMGEVDNLIGLQDELNQTT